MLCIAFGTDGLKVIGLNPRPILPSMDNRHYDQIVPGYSVNQPIIPAHKPFAGVGDHALRRQFGKFGQTGCCCHKIFVEFERRLRVIVCDEIQYACPVALRP